MKKLSSIFIFLIFISNAHADFTVITVAKSGGDFSNPIAAMNSIKDASARKRYIIKIGPGEYELGFDRQLRMKPYVSIEGAGSGVTTISGTVVGRFKGLIRAVEHSGIRHLSVSNSVPVGTRKHLTGIYIGKKTSRFRGGVSLRHLSVGGKTTGILSLSNELDMEDVSFGAGYTGLHAYNSEVTITGGSTGTGHGSGGIAPISVGGINMRFIKSKVTIDGLLSRANTDVGPVHVSVSQNSNVIIKNSELGPNATGNNFVTDGTSRVRVINTSLQFDGSNLDPRIKCINSYDLDRFEEFDNNCSL